MPEMESTQMLLALAEVIPGEDLASSGDLTTVVLRALATLTSLEGLIE